MIRENSSDEQQYQDPTDAARKTEDELPVSHPWRRWGQPNGDFDSLDDIYGEDDRR